MVPSANVGAYSNFPGHLLGVEPLMALGGTMPGPYRVPEVPQARGPRRSPHNHLPDGPPYRGVSRPVITAAMGALMDCAAAPASGSTCSQNPAPQLDRRSSLIPR